MPRRALELLARETPFLTSTETERLIGSVTPRPLFKLFTTYDHPWWLPAGVTAGRTVTDLPIRQTYYWPLRDGKPSTSGRSMLMASYDDGLNIGFWDGFRRKRGARWMAASGEVEPVDAREWYPSCAAEDADRYEVWHANQAPSAMVEEVQRELGLVHDLNHTPPAVHAAFRDWGDDPYGGGWNAWNIGVRSPSVFEDILQPQPGSPVYVCGEAYSNAQGWVEGALETADRMLDKHFGVPELSGS